MMFDHQILESKLFKKLESIFKKPIINETEVSQNKVAVIK